MQVALHQVMFRREGALVWQPASKTDLQQAGMGQVP